MKADILRGLAFIFFQGLAFLAGILWWLPGWTIVQALCILAFSFAALFFGIQFWRKLMQTMSKDGRSKTIRWMLRLGIASMGIEWLLVLLFILISATQYPFPPRFDHAQHFPDYGTSLYMYDVGFLDNRTEIRKRFGWTPFTYHLTNVNDFAMDVVFQQNGNEIISRNVRINLDTEVCILTY